MSDIIMYSTRICPYCVRAEQLLHRKGVDEIQKVLVDHHPERMQEMIDITGRRTVPQIFIGDTHVGGYDDLAALEMAGQLDPLLEKVAVS